MKQILVNTFKSAAYDAFLISAIFAVFGILDLTQGGWYIVLALGMFFLSYLNFQAAMDRRYLANLMERAEEVAETKKAE